MSDSEDDRQQQGSNEQRQRQLQREESEMRGGEAVYLEWSYRKVHQGPQAGGCREHPHEGLLAGRLKRSRTTRGCGREAFAVGSQTVTTRGVIRLAW